jgi:hypothetical protein
MSGYWKRSTHAGTPKYIHKQNNPQWMEFCQQSFGFVPREPLHKDYPYLVKQIQAYLTRVQINDKEYDRFMTFFRLYTRVNRKTETHKQFY